MAERSRIARRHEELDEVATVAATQAKSEPRIEIVAERGRMHETRRFASGCWRKQRRRARMSRSSLGNMAFRRA